MNAYKNCSIALLIKELQMKATMRYHFTPIRMTTVKNHMPISVGKNVEKLESLYSVGRNGKWCRHFAKQSGRFFND